MQEARSDLMLVIVWWIRCCVCHKRRCSIKMGSNDSIYYEVTTLSLKERKERKEKLHENENLFHTLEHKHDSHLAVVTKLKSIFWIRNIIRIRQLESPDFEVKLSSGAIIFWSKCQFLSVVAETYTTLVVCRIITGQFRYNHVDWGENVYTQSLSGAGTKTLRQECFLNVARLLLCRM